jgi:uncharacterized coiled-coil DUF342 family protein
MAEPTLKDVLDAISKLATKSELGDGLAKLRSELGDGLAELRSEFGDRLTELRRELVARIDAHRAETEAHRAETEAHRAETKKGFEDLDEELTRHASVHREIEKDIQNLKRRPPRTAARPTRRR